MVVSETNTTPVRQGKYATMTLPISEEDYPALFQQNVLRSVQAIRSRARRETVPRLTEAARTRVFTMLDYAFRLREAWPALSELLRLLAPQFDRAGYWVQWLPYLEQGIAASVAYTDDKTEAALSCDLGLLYQRLGKLDIAQLHLGRACTLAREQADPLLLCLALQQLAEIARLQRDYPQCDALLAEASMFFAADHPAQAYGLFTAGKAAFDRHDHVAATHAFTQAMTLWQAEGNHGRAALCIQNLGRLATARGEPQVAIPLYEQAIEHLTSTGDLSSLAVVQMNLGIAYYEYRQYTQAIAFYRVAEASFHALGDDRSLATVYNNLGLAHAALGGWEEAEISLRYSIEAYQKVGDSKARISAKGNLGIVYLEQAQNVPAIHILQEALTELQSTNHDPEYERLWQELAKYLKLAQQRSQ